MQIKKFKILILLVVFILLSANQKAGVKVELKNSWAQVAANLKENFFKTPEAQRIGDNCLIYQSENGGFPKNQDAAQILPPAEIEIINKMQSRPNYETIDNDATTTEITYLARLYNATKKEKYKKAALSGIDFLIKNQLDSGCWRQCPLWHSDLKYQAGITFNDNAIVNVLELLQKAAHKSSPFEFIDDKRANLSLKAFNNGINCILKTQVKIDDELTVWAAQYDIGTLKPRQARAFEPAALDGGKESANIVLLLMSLPNPSDEIINSINSAVKWFDTHKITGYEKVYFTDNHGRKDYALVECPNCEPFWARFYSLTTQEPVFAARSMRKTCDIADIPYERRNGYEWYSYDGQKVLNEYKKWKQRIKK